MSDEQEFDWQSIWEELDFDDASRREQVLEERLRQRAEQYATPIVDQQTDADSTYTVLEFELGGERYSIDVMKVIAVRTAPNITVVPGTPTFYRGVVNLRGRITTVLDLRYFFDLSLEEKKPPNELVVINENKLEIGLLAHHVHGVRDVPFVDVEPATFIRYAHGVTVDRMVVLDASAMFEDERLTVGGGDEVL